jgi:hypothetical protein
MRGGLCMKNRKHFIIFGKVIGLIGLLTLIAACSTNVAFRVYDRDTGKEIPEYNIHIEGKVLQPGDTITLSTADWAEFKARVQAEGYRVEECSLEKKIYVGRLVVGYLLFWPELGWCYGPKEEQVFYLIKNKE